VPDRRTDPTVIRDRLSANDADAIDNTQLEIRSAADVYLAHGDFVAAQMIGFLDETAASVSAVEGGRLFRATGEMSWATGSPERPWRQARLSQQGVPEPAVREWGRRCMPARRRPGNGRIAPCRINLSRDAQP
jgi:hypothetical protein